MDFRFLFQRIRYIILNPAIAWEAIQRENRPIKYVRGSFFLPLIILVGISSFLGSLIFINTTLGAMFSVLTGIGSFLMLYGGVYASAFIVSEITKALDLGKDFVVAFKLVTYSLAPMFICLSVSKLFESLIFVNLLSFYGLYIFWVGMEKMLAPPDHKKMPMLIAVTITLVIIIGLLQVVISRLTDTLYFTFFA